MQYKTIRGASIAECMMRLREAYGQDAVILKQRELSSGGLLGSGLFSRKSYEMEYMVPESWSTAKKRPYSSSIPKRIARDPNLDPKEFLTREAPILEKLLSMKGKDRLLHERTQASQHNDKKQKEIDEKEVLQHLFPSSQQAMEQEESYSPQAPPAPLSIRENELRHTSSTASKTTNSHFLNIKERLSRAQMSPAFTSDFLQHLEQSLSSKDKEEYRLVEEKTRDNLAKIIRTIPSRAPVRGECRAIMVLGPTGAGKTTSLAKLAARFHIVEKRAVSIYSLDHYRLAAAEQLKTYANVMGLDFHVPLTKEDFIESLRRDGAELILVDTSGAGYSDKERLAELKDYVSLCEQELFVERNLVIAANTNPLLLERTMLAYENIGFDKLILTKTDESDFVGAFIETADKFKRPFSFIMDGQKVPENIRDADPQEIASMVLGDPVGMYGQ